MAKLKVGDLVKLKSGGPVMTVNSIYLNHIDTTWFAGAKHNTGRFDESALEPAGLPPVAATSKKS